MSLVPESANDALDVFDAPSFTTKKSGRDVIQFFPTFGYYDDLTRLWNLNVMGRAIRPRADSMRRKLLLRVIRQVLSATDEQLESEIFQERVHGFLMMTKRGRRVRVRLGDFKFRVEKRTNGNGEFRARLRLDEDELAQLIDLNDVERHPWLNVQSRPTKKIRDPHEGRIQIVPPSGFSVITDIDDTIKTSNVPDRTELLANTFFEPFSAVDGMSKVFQSWSRSGIAFHYVSSSPWQLFAPLSDFLGEAGFPHGSFHLRTIRIRDPSILQLVVGRKRSKKRAIKQILQAFPKRRFVLVGDVGEKDPEIYGAIARRFADQVDQICLRRIGSHPIEPKRFARAFRKVPLRKWRIFDDPAELESLVPTPNGWIDESL